jgi:hypothetical protein
MKGSGREERRGDENGDEKPEDESRKPPTGLFLPDGHDSAPVRRRLLQPQKGGLVDR